MTERPFQLTLAEGAILGGVEVSDGIASDDNAGDKTAIVLHGGPGASMDYLRPQMDALAASRRLLYYDQRGGGRSVGPPNLVPAGIEQHLADLREVIAHVGGRPALIGYSWGGLLALRFALDEPQTIDRLLLISPAPPWAGAREQMKRQLRAAAERPAAKAFVASLDKTDRRQRFAGAVVGYFYDPERAFELTPFVVRERAERAVWDSLGDYDLRPRLSSLALPTLVVHGVDDPVPIESAREIAAMARDATLVELARCGHCPFIEGGDALFRAGLTFLR